MYWPQRPYRQQQPNHPPSPESKKRGFNDDTKADDTKIDNTPDESQMDDSQDYTPDDSQTDERPSKKRGTTEETEDEIIDISDIMEGYLSQPMITDQNPNEKTLGFLNSILDKFHSLITTHFRTPQISESPSISSPPPDIKSLITVAIASHSSTTRETYQQNYKKTNAEFKAKFKTIYDDGILREYTALFNTDDNKNFTFAVDQGTNSLADCTRDRTQDFQDTLTRDAENMLIMYEKSKDFLRSIPKIMHPYNSSSPKKYISDIKETLNKLELSRYTNIIIAYYKYTIVAIIVNIEVLIDALNYILSITPNDPIILTALADVNKYKDEFGDLLFLIDQVHNEKDPITKITDFHKIIQQSTSHPIKWGPSRTVNVNEDIYKLILLRKIIVKVILINTNILGNNDLKKQISEIGDIFKTYISNSVINELPLFLENSNDKRLFYDGILKKSFWRSENHLLSHYDTEFMLMPNPKEGPNDFDCNYGLHIFALMLNLNSSSQRLILPQTEAPTRSTHQLKQQQYPGVSGPRRVESSMWRKHNLKNSELNILDTIVNIFKQNWFGSFGNLQGADLELFTFIAYKLDSEIFNIESILFTGQIRIASPEESEYNVRFTKKLEAIVDTDPNNRFRFAYCRVIEFTHFLTLILIGKREGTSSRSGTRIQSSKKTILLSELIYLFQYLLQFDYVVYMITSCRACRPGQIPQQILRRGGNKRQTLKRRTYKKKTLKRKTLKRKTLKRKTLKRK